MVKISELRAKEVININDGRRLGPIKDIDIDLEEGRICAIILPTYGSTKLIGFFSREQEIVIPWEKIVRIGIDVILVDLPVSQEAHMPGYYQGGGGGGGRW